MPNYTENTLFQYPSKKWGFVGSVHPLLSYIKKDGSQPSEKDFDSARQVGPSMAGIETRAWDTALDALKDAEKLNVVITIGLPEMNEDVMNDVEQSRVRHKII